MTRGRKLVAIQVRCQTVISMALSMTDEQWRQVYPTNRKIMLEAAEESLANGRPILILPVEAEQWRAACEKAGIPADGRLREANRDGGAARMDLDSGHPGGVGVGGGGDKAGVRLGECAQGSAE